MLAHAERCRARRDELVNAEVALEEATAALERGGGRARGARGGAAQGAQEGGAEARGRRARAAGGAGDGGRGVRGRRSNEREPGPTGADAVELLIAPNPGVPAAPLRDIASGGELSRVMLALLGTANDGSEATLVFDEVDAGVGGQTARAVGEQLRALGEGRQVVCITHLPADRLARRRATSRSPRTPRSSPRSRR